MFFLLDPAIWRYQLYINLVSQDLEWTWIIWSFSTKVGIELIEFSWNYHGKFIPDITRPWHHGMLENPPCIEHWTFRIYCITVCPKMSWLSCPSWLCRTTRDSKNCNIPFSQVVENQQGNTRVDSGCSSTQCVHHPETMDILFLAAAYKKQCERKSPESDWELVGFWRPIRIIKNAIQIVKSWNSDFQISSKRLTQSIPISSPRVHHPSNSLVAIKSLVIPPCSEQTKPYHVVASCLLYNVY